MNYAQFTIDNAEKGFGTINEEIWDETWAKDSVVDEAVKPLASKDQLTNAINNLSNSISQNYVNNKDFKDAISSRAPLTHSHTEYVTKDELKNQINQEENEEGQTITTITSDITNIKNLKCETINGIDPNNFSLNDHNHDGIYSNIDHEHTNYVTKDEIQINTDLDDEEKTQTTIPSDITSVKNLICETLNDYTIGTRNGVYLRPNSIAVIDENPFDIYQYIDFHELDSIKLDYFIRIGINMNNDNIREFGIYFPSFIRKFVFDENGNFTCDTINNINLKNEFSNYVKSDVYNDYTKNVSDYLKNNDENIDDINKNIQTINNNIQNISYENYLL